MEVDVSYIAAFLVGLFGGVHCVGMCGGIVGALCLGLGPSSENSAQQNTRIALPYLLSYNAGRIGSYILAGILMGGVGWLGSHLFKIYAIQQTLEIIAAVFMLALGLYVAGWWRILANVERFGGKVIWQRLEPIGRRFMPVTTYRQAFTLGLVWGWLPCGLVYSVIIWTISTQSPLEGGLLMLSFGLGTLPNLLLMGVFASTLNQFIQQPWVRQVAGVMIMIFAGVMFYRGLI
ncbi:MAG: sulfite exporter TauE/SafE family protein [Gammaproteobacteria bacterium]|nr:sulfite exporter TauE/SafE family protein [Gammaproteobacteria bacterium]MCW8987151.1 sulfite exporter TauE/SafE family protein [Gammaproteobacteria bacterium]MCW9031355.1 sulfite exporter TauE/SafE family protein [Gammaproteobacteria bacterium]